MFQQGDAVHYKGRLHRQSDRQWTRHIVLLMKHPGLVASLIGCSSSHSFAGGGHSQNLCVIIFTFGRLVDIDDPRMLKKTIVIVLNFDVYFFLSRSQFELFQFIDRRSFKIVREKPQVITRPNNPGTLTTLFRASSLMLILDFLCLSVRSFSPIFAQTFIQNLTHFVDYLYAIVAYDRVTDTVAFPGTMTWCLVCTTMSSVSFEWI